MVGERGGKTATLEAGIALVEEHKASLAQSIRADILAWLDQYPSWHRDNLRVNIPADSKNALGAVVGGLVRAGIIEETGERRPSSDPASHSRKSSVYRLRLGRGERRSAEGGGPGNSLRVHKCSPDGEPPKVHRTMDRSEAALRQPQQETEPVGGVDNSLASPTDRLFDISTDYYGQEAA